MKPLYQHGGFYKPQHQTDVPQGAISDDKSTKSSSRDPIRIVTRQIQIRAASLGGQKAGGTNKLRDDSSKGEERVSGVNLERKCPHC